MRWKAVLKELSKTIGATLLVFALVESLLKVAYFVRNATVSYVALPYAIGQGYGPIPPWADGLRILEPDESLIWRNRSRLRRSYIDVFSPVHTERDRTSLLRRFLPVIPASLKGNPVWEISLNSHGFRDTDFPDQKASSTFRIICLGDSWTFGANVGQEEAYPQRLRALLGQEFPAAHFQVFNLGVLGYSSYQGLELLRRKIIDLAPDLVVIAFVMNDSSLAGYRDKDMPLEKGPATLARRIGRFFEKLEFYKLPRYWAQLIKYKPKSITDHLVERVDSAGKAEEAVDYEKLEPWVRVSPKDYEKNVLEMIDLARGQGAGVILLYNQLSGDAGEVAGIGRLGRVSPYRVVLEEISNAEGVPLVDASAVVARARRRIERNLEEMLDLRPTKANPTSGRQEVEIIFRVYLGKHAVAKTIYIAGAHPKLGEGVPNRVAMYDDGTHGDQRAGDNVWSYVATFKPGAKLFYVYTNSGEEGKWEGLDVPHIRSFKVEAKNNDGKVYRPIESFGEIHMQADAWHTNAAGYTLIAKALLEVLKRNQKVKKYLDQVADDRS